MFFSRFFDSCNNSIKDFKGNNLDLDRDIETNEVTRSRNVGILENNELLKCENLFDINSSYRYLND